MCKTSWYLPIKIYLANKHFICGKKEKGKKNKPETKRIDKMYLYLYGIKMLLNYYRPHLLHFELFSSTKPLNIWYLFLLFKLFLGRLSCRCYFLLTIFIGYYLFCDVLLNQENSYRFDPSIWRAPAKCTD